MQDIVDEAQRVYVLVCNKSIASERDAQEVLAPKLRLHGYVVQTEKYIASDILGEPCDSRGEPKRKINRVDLLVTGGNDKKVLVELKHANKLDEHQNQMRKYMELPELSAVVSHGVLIGFPNKKRPFTIHTQTASWVLDEKSQKYSIIFNPDNGHPSVEALSDTRRHFGR